ncbi:Hillarin [Taenia solium]|eukprot:TsM_000241600 transcript=TsM_000241600 gene=TsM_000241600
MSDIERARVIFRWIASKNMQKIMFDSVPPDSPEEVLLSFKDNKTSFARIYEIMCTYAGLHCVAISGYAKGVDYFPGDHFQGLPANHSWNAVYLRGSWQLVDAHWATRYLSSGVNMQDNVVYEYDDFYFLMEPQQAVYSHFPEDCRWQLLSKQLTLAQFESLPLTKSQFFKCAMDFREEHHGMIQVVDGCIRMSLGFWRPGAFTYKLQHLLGSARASQPALVPVRAADLVDVLQTSGRERLLLKDFVLQETAQDALNFFIRLPSRGAYFLTIYAQDLTNPVMAKNGTFRAACEYKLVFSEGEACFEPYPACDDMNWGPSWLHARHYGLEFAHPSGVISLPPGRLTPSGEHVEPGRLELRCTRLRPEVQLFSKLKCNHLPDESLGQFHRIHLTEKEAIFEFSLPEPVCVSYNLQMWHCILSEDGNSSVTKCYQPKPRNYSDTGSSLEINSHDFSLRKKYGRPNYETLFGLIQTGGEYGLDIYANEPEDGRAYTHVCQYLVHYEAPPGWTAEVPPEAVGSVGVSPSRVVSTAEVNFRPVPRHALQRESLIRLRQMPAYGAEAPSIGQLPQPYLEPQITSIQNHQRLSHWRGSQQSVKARQPLISLFTLFT